MKAIREYLRRLGKELDQERMPSDRQLSLFVMGMAGTYLFGRGAEQASYVVFGNYIFSDSVLFNQRLLTACKQQDLYQVKEVLQKGADVHFTDQYGNTVLFSVVGYEECLAIVDCLLEHGAELNLVDDEDKTPLWIAIEHHCFSMARLLLSYGADANAQNQDGETVLFWTASRSYARMTELLLSYGANPNLKSVDGLTPLHETTEGLHKKEDLKNAKLFLQAGANVNAVDDGGATPLDYAQESGFLELQALLLEYGGKPGESLSLAEIKATNAIAYQVALRTSKPEENNQPFFQPSQNSSPQENPL